MKLRKTVLLIISLILFFLPFLLWGNGYIVGGDDTKLYYVFPLQFLNNYALNVASMNTLAGAMTGYASVAYFSPIFFIFSLAKSISFLSTQMLFYGLTLSLGFLFFYLLLGLWLPTKNTAAFVLKLVSALMYVFSPFIVNTLFTHQLLPMYLVMLLPLCLYLFFTGLRLNVLGYSLLAVLLFSLLSTTMNALPWIVAILIAAMPLIFIEAIEHFATFIKHILLMLAAFLLLNLYWIFHFINAAVHPSGIAGQLQYYSSPSFVAENLRILMGVYQMFHPIAIPLQLFSTPPESIPVHLVIMGMVPLLIFMSAGIVVHFYKEKAIIFYTVLCGFLLSWFLYSPNLGVWGPKLFLSLSTHIPFFIMFRNMYDKFSLPLAFYLALVFAISLFVLLDILRKKTYVFVMLIVASLAGLLPMTLTLLEYKDKMMVNKSFSGSFNDDYMDLTSYLASLHTASHVLWIPLNGPTYANVEDKFSSGSFYSGLSPLQELAGIQDYAGRFSFIRPSDFFYGEKLFQKIADKKYDEVGKTLQEVNAKYIVVDHQILPESIQEFMYGGEKKSILTMQGDSFKKVILGKKMLDFGKRYTLYEINSRYANDKLMLSNRNAELSPIDAKLSYKRINSSTYLLSLSNLKEETSLFFLEPFDRRWTIHADYKGRTKLLTDLHHTVLYDYANSWSIPISSIRLLGKDYYTLNSDGSINTVLLLTFSPVIYNNVIYSVSIVSFIAIAGYSIVSIYSYRKKHA